MFFLSYPDRSLPLQNASTLSGLVAPSWRLSRPSSRCGSANRNTTKLVPPSSTANASKSPPALSLAHNCECFVDQRLQFLFKSFLSKALICYSCFLINQTCATPLTSSPGLSTQIQLFVRKESFIIGWLSLEVRKGCDTIRTMHFQTTHIYMSFQQRKAHLNNVNRVHLRVYRTCIDYI